MLQGRIGLDRRRAAVQDRERRAALARLDAGSARRPAGAVRDRWESLNALMGLAEEAPADTTLKEFVAELLERQAGQHEPTMSAVTLATLHSAKGLEWDSVYIAGASEGLLPIGYARTDAGGRGGTATVLRRHHARAAAAAPVVGGSEPGAESLPGRPALRSGRHGDASAFRVRQPVASVVSPESTASRTVGRLSWRARRPAAAGRAARHARATSVDDQRRLRGGVAGPRAATRWPTRRRRRHADSARGSTGRRSCPGSTRGPIVTESSPNTTGRCGRSRRSQKP